MTGRFPSGSLSGMAWELKAMPAAPPESPVGRPLRADGGRGLLARLGSGLGMNNSWVRALLLYLVMREGSYFPKLIGTQGTG